MDVFEWAASLSTEHDHDWVEEVRGNTGYDQIWKICRICDEEKPTAMVRIMR
jgi:hypothetical protein